jgi:hypothetical protein
MAERILNELTNIKSGETNLQQHLKQFISSLLIDRADLSQFEAYSAQQRISNGTSESVFRVREAYSHLKDYETKHRALLNVETFSLRNSTLARKKNHKNQLQ